VNNFSGKGFLDVGSGSGLFSLAARRLGAQVYSFDYEPRSVACTNELERRYFPDDDRWIVTEGSVLDQASLDRLGSFDIVYSWGVLHHTGAMWQALENVSQMVADHGKLFISIYNDQDGASRRWLIVKRLYNWLPRAGRFMVLGPAFVYLWGVTLLRDTFLGNPLRTWFNYKRDRGMSPWRDVVDWVGGYPFEVARPEEIFDFFKEKGFELLKLKTCYGGHGCNEFVFKKALTSSSGIH
jgi:2-polyprenyl-6-hydroxyphenyl methylase/3-demethylubiquinone-9 3-methyltransferase